MNPWLETIAVIIVVLLGILLGRTLARFHKNSWIIGYVVSLIFITILLLTRYNTTMSFIPPFSYLATGRVKLVIMALAITIGLISPIARLPHKFQKVIICAVMTAVVGWFCVLPFLVPALIKTELLSLETKLDSDGICYQTRDYTCGPAAAVTVLAKLGITAHEGQIAVAAHTSPVTGTFPKCLYTALKDRYYDQGLRCQYRQFDSIAQLTDAGLTLVVIKDSFMLDHCVAVLEVSDKTVTIADPTWGKMQLQHDQFEKIWRFSGIVLSRDMTERT